MVCKRVHKSDPESVYVGRGENGDFDFAAAMKHDRLGEHGWLGNQYRETNYNRENSVALFERDLNWAIEASAKVKWALVGLYGKKLGCYCRPEQTCHGDVLAATVNRLYWETK